jgi:protein-tyrosine-phosphatase
MAEGFARRYGSDVLIPLSAGLAPAAIVQPLTKKVMADKNIDITDQFAKHVSEVDTSTVDLVINMSGHALPRSGAVEIRDWKVEDPIGRSEEVYVAVRDQIEYLVMRLILELRQAGRMRRQPASSPSERERRRRAGR